MSQNALKRNAFAFTLIVLSAACAHSQVQEHTNQPPIIVEASRLGRSSLQMPSQVEVVTAAEIARAGYATTAEVLEKRGGVFTRSMNGTPALAQLSLRGFGENSAGRVLLLLNGERLNNPDMAPPNLLRVPVTAIERIEIIRGPQTVLHGDYASGGVINIITTAEPQELRTTTIGASAGSYDSYSAYSATAGAITNQGFSYRAALNWDKSGGYRNNSDYESYEANAALRQEFAANRFVDLNLFYNHSDYGLPGALDYATYKRHPRHSTTPHDRAELESFGLNLGGRTPLGYEGYLQGNLTASRRKSHSSWQGISYGAPWTSLYDNSIYSYAFLPQYVLEGELAGCGNTLTIGSDLRYDATDFTSNYASPGFSSLLEWEYDRATYGGYLQDELFLTEQLSLLAGARLEWFDDRAHGTATRSRTQREHALEGALLYRPDELSKIYAKVSRFYHAPLIDEIFAGSGTPNLTLNPESGLNYELGGATTLADDFQLALALYDMELDHEIYYDPARFQNLNSPGATRRYGADASLGWRCAQRAALWFNYNFVQARFRGGPYKDRRIPMVPRHTIGLNGSYTIGAGLSLLAGLRHVTNQVLGSDFNNEAIRLNPYLLADCGLRYEPPRLKRLSLHCSIDNLFNEKYSDYAGWSGSSYYYPGRGRFLRVGGSYSF